MTACSLRTKCEPQPSHRIGYREGKGYRCAQALAATEAELATLQQQNQARAAPSHRVGCREGRAVAAAQALAATEAELATLQQQNQAQRRDVERFQQRERLLKEARGRRSLARSATGFGLIVCLLCKQGFTRLVPKS